MLSYEDQDAFICVFWICQVEWIEGNYYYSTTWPYWVLCISAHKNDASSLQMGNLNVALMHLQTEATAGQPNE